MAHAIGAITEIIGVVIVAKFKEHETPAIYNAITVQTNLAPATSRAGKVGSDF